MEALRGWSWRPERVVEEGGEAVYIHGGQQGRSVHLQQNGPELWVVQGLCGALQHVVLAALTTSTFQRNGVGVAENNWSAVVIGTITFAWEAEMEEPGSIVSRKEN